MNKRELLIAAKCAEHYPPGRGDLYFSHVDIDSDMGAIEEIKNDPKAGRFG